MKPALISISLLAALLIAACGSGGATTTNMETATPTASTTPDVWATLRKRPLDLPTLAPGEPCPTTPGRDVSNFRAALGAGPIYPIGLSTDGVLQYGHTGEFAGSEWGGNKVLWVSNSAYGGPALIRGRQLDGPNEVRFMGGAVPPAELQFPVEGSGASPDLEPGWRQLPSYTRVRASGCYAYQVDGLDFTEVIVFEATEETPSP